VENLLKQQISLLIIIMANFVAEIAAINIKLLTK
jgi:hypothetical protein